MNQLPPDDRLRGFFDSDPGRCRKQYADLRYRLMKFFDWRNCASPEDLADETITRALARISEGVEVPHLASYCYGIAKFVLMEEWKRRDEVAITVDPPDRAGPAGNLTGVEQTMLARDCLRLVSREEADLLREYYWEDRKELARRHGMTPNALRIRVHRILAKIRDQVDGSGELGKQTTPAPPAAAL